MLSVRKPIFTHLRMAVHRSNLRRHDRVFGALQAGNGRDRPVLAWRDRVLVEVALNSVSSLLIGSWLPSVNSSPGAPESSLLLR